jgi:hypothetical protein
MAINTCYGVSTSTDPVRAVAELATQTGSTGRDGLLFFCSPDIDLDVLGQELVRTYTCPVFGCTSSGHFSPEGSHRSGIIGVAFHGGGLRLRTFPISPLSGHVEQISGIADEIAARAEAEPHLNRFGLMLIDGLSMAEEKLVAALYQRVGNLPLIGGSAGDNMKFEHTCVYADGRFLSDAATLTLFETVHPVATIKTQHFARGDIELVITEADPERRVIREMNGEPAAVTYAEAIGLSIDALTPAVFSRHPLVLTLCGEPYVRSIQRVNADLSLSCYCAIEEGLIVSIGHALDPIQTMAAAMARLRREIPQPAVVLGCDCVLRQLDFQQAAISQDMSRLMAANRLFGFYTYGEQYNGLHVNQTLTAVAIGG